MDSLPRQPTSSKVIKIKSSTLVTRQIVPIVGNQSGGAVGGGGAVCGGGGGGGTCNNCCKDVCGMLQLCLVQNGSQVQQQQVCVNCGKRFLSQRDLNENPSLLTSSGPRKCEPTSGIPNIPGIGNVDPNSVPLAAQQAPQTCTTGKTICKQICLTPSKILRLAENKILGGDHKDCQADCYQGRPSCSHRSKTKRCPGFADRKVQGCECCEKSKRKPNFAFGTSSCTRKNDCNSSKSTNRCSCRQEINSCRNQLQVRGVACCPQIPPPVHLFPAQEPDPCPQFYNAGADDAGGYGQDYGRGIGEAFHNQRPTFGPEQNQQPPPAGGCGCKQQNYSDESISDAANFINQGYPPPKNGQGFNNPGNYPAPNILGQGFNSAGNYPAPNIGQGFNSAGNYPASNNGQGFNNTGNYPAPNIGQGFNNPGNYPTTNNDGQGFNNPGNYPPSNNNGQGINNFPNYPASYNGQRLSNADNYPVGQGGRMRTVGPQAGYQPRYSRALGQTVRNGNRGNQPGRFDKSGDYGGPKVSKGGRRQDEQMLTDSQTRIQMMDNFSSTPNTVGTQVDITAGTQTSADMSYENHTMSHSDKESHASVPEYSSFASQTRRNVQVQRGQPARMKHHRGGHRQRENGGGLCQIPQPQTTQTCQCKRTLWALGEL